MDIPRVRSYTESVHKKPRLLIVDDEIDLRTLLQRHFERQGFAIVSTGDAETALDLLGAERFDAIILDNCLPGLQGLEALQKIVRRGKAPVVMITGHANPETHRDAILLGAKNCAQALQFDELEATVRGLLV